jgi:hypothetical protein
VTLTVSARNAHIEPVGAGRARNLDEWILLLGTRHNYKPAEGPKGRDPRDLWVLGQPGNAF